MKFPGRRNKKHYFPVNDKARLDHVVTKKIDDVFIVGIDCIIILKKTLQLLTLYYWV